MFGIYPCRYQYDTKKRRAYINAFDLLENNPTMERKSWDYISLGLCRQEMKEVWASALADVQGKSRYNFIYGKERK